MKSVLLYSGGLDSACAWWILDKPPVLFVGGNNGPARSASFGELKAIAKQKEVSKEFDQSLIAVRANLEIFQRPAEWHFPREQLLCQIAWANGFDEAIISWNKSDGTTEKWANAAIEKFQGACWTGSNHFNVRMPFINKTKAEMVSEAIAKGCPPEFLYASHSCVRSSTACGECNNCKDREVALANV